MARVASTQVPITTKATQGGGKEAGFYFDDNSFVSLDRMGDGVSETVALIVELSLERNKIFVLEEPETNLHPNGLKSLLKMVRSSMKEIQFIISTHSNIVLRELGSDDQTKIFRVARISEEPRAASLVEEVPRTPIAHMELLRELGYEFTDVGLHEGWLFLEEASAETILNDVLIPHFAPTLRGRLRSFSAGGVANVEPSVSEFRRLITFVHLQPVYQGRIWVFVDGDEAGKAAVERLRGTFRDLDEKHCICFSQENFERYYPSDFESRVNEVLAIGDKPLRRAEKGKLLIGLHPVPKTPS
jgi:predicted ATP-dependent endonuclease of OLD family